MTHWKASARGLLKEPLIHFLVAGALVFAFSLWRGEAADPTSRTIEITQAQVAQLASNWEQSWRRPPTREELDALVQDMVREEIYVREATRLGLDQDDPIIRRRLRSKMEFLETAEVENAMPTDATLAALLAKNPARYAADPRFSFDQLYLGSDSAATRAQALAALASLKRGEPAASIGISLPENMETAGRSDVARVFGDDFAGALAALPAGKWAGPVASGYGLHVVRLRAVSVPVPPQLADVRQRVENDWRAATLAERKARAYRTLLDGYVIRIAQP